MNINYITVKTIENGQKHNITETTKLLKKKIKGPFKNMNNNHNIISITVK